MSRLSSSRHFLAFFCLLALTTMVAEAANSLDEIRAMQHQLRNLPLADLMELTVTSVSKKTQSVAQSAAAVFVLTQNDIHRSGATSIPEALCKIPGLQVARIDASQWSVTARGFGGRYANKLLVLIDGRSVYTPIFGGVDWDEQDLLLEDIERIEVIRGPGASVWGANAVNGVINIITQPAADTQGGRLTFGLGNELRSFGSARFGASLNKDVHYRAYIKAVERDNSGSVQGEPLVEDDWRMYSGGFKIDWEISDTDQWTLDGRTYHGDIGQTLVAFDAESQTFYPATQSYHIEGGHLLSRWQHDWSPTSQHQLQIYYNRAQRDDPAAPNRVNTFDVDFQHYFMITDSQTLTWGLGYRRINSKITAGLRAGTDPKYRRQNLYNGFLQSEWKLFDEQLTVTLGSKFEHTFFTGFEVQPSAKLLWAITPQHILWSSISRAVRTPSIFERDGQGVSAQVILPGTSVRVLPIVISNDEYDSEQLTSYELGYRFLPQRSFSLDVAAYYNVYHTLRSLNTLPLVLQSTPNPQIELPVQAGNNIKGRSYGVEITTYWAPYDRLRLSLAYTFNRVILQLGQQAYNSLIASNLLDETRTPQQQISFRTSFDLPMHTYLDIELSYTDRVKQFDIQSTLKDNLNLDIRFAWQPIKTLELSLMGQNLSDKTNRQIQPEVFSGYASNQERQFYFKLDWRF